MLLLFLVGIVISVGVMSQLMPTQMSSDELGKRELIPWSLSSHLPSDGHDDLFTFRCYAILRYFATDGYRFYVFAPLSVALGQLHLSRSCSVTFAGACMSSCLKLSPHSNFYCATSTTCFIRFLKLESRCDWFVCAPVWSVVHGGKDILDSRCH